MSAPEPIKADAGLSPLLIARTAGFFWLSTIIAGSIALLSARGSMTAMGANLIAVLCYAAATVLVYLLLKPVSRNLSLQAALFSILGCTVSILLMLQLAPRVINPLVFFGVHCLLVGYLILRSTFLPRLIGGLMVIAGLGWLTHLSPHLAAFLFPYNLAPGIVGEFSLTVWLLTKGIDAPRWFDQARVLREAGSMPG